MAAPCGVPLGLCAFRLTRLESTGCVAAEPDNSFVSTDAISLAVNPNVTAGVDNDLTGGCDCTVASFRGTDKLKRFDLVLTFPKFAPAAAEMLTGSGVMLNGTDPVGANFPTELSCGETQPAVALEWWVKNWNNDSQDATYPWIHGVFPQSLWQIGDTTYQNDFAPRVFNGFSRSNSCWGQGPYGDGPEDEGYTGDGTDISTGGQWYTATDPPEDNGCDYADITPGS